MRGAWRLNKTFSRYYNIETHCVLLREIHELPTDVVTTAQDPGGLVTRGVPTPAVLWEETWTVKQLTDDSNRLFCAICRADSVCIWWCSWLILPYLRFSICLTHVISSMVHGGLTSGFLCFMYKHCIVKDTEDPRATVIESLANWITWPWEHVFVLLLTLCVYSKNNWKL